MQYTPKKCRIDGCYKFTRIHRSICRMHEQRWQKYKSFTLPERPTLPPGIIRICKIHGALTEKQLYCNGFSKVYKKPQYSCIRCTREKQNIYRKQNKEKLNQISKNTYQKRKSLGKIKETDHHFNTRLMRNFCITLSDYRKMEETQKGLCKICKRHPNDIAFKKRQSKSLCVDHCHKTGKVRGLLCFKCNGMLGMAEDTIPILESAIEYLSLSRCHT